MAARNIAPKVDLTGEEKDQLSSFANSRSLPHGQVYRAKIVLLAAEGMTNIEIADALNTTRETVGKWRKRYLEKGIEGLYDELRPGKPRSISDEEIS
ncbi:MAG: helix-turn-helix domain-containing protein, partial [Spirochaetaceae bacterium]|nr:helix-turn-helix domain-containing protein [Spirochaetaceae bacterium]